MPCKIARTKSSRLALALAIFSLLAARPAIAQRKKPVRKAPPPSAAPVDPPTEPASAAVHESPAPPTPPPAAVEARPAPEQPSTPAERNASTQSLFEAELALHWFQRHLSFSGDRQNVFPPYDMSGAPAAE